MDEAFDRIRVWGDGALFLSQLDLTTLPTLPPTLRILICSGNENLTSLPSLPLTLECLYCDNNRLDSLPPLPPGLEILNCSGNPLQTLPPLPDGLIELRCRNTMLTVLPKLPASLRYLMCHHNSIRCVDPLPASLGYLDCSSNPDLANIDVYPSTLTFIFCSDTGLPSRFPQEGMRRYIQRLAEHSERKRTVARRNMIHEDLMMKVWHPSRVERLMLAGVDMEDM